MKRNKENNEIDKINKNNNCHCSCKLLLYMYMYNHISLLEIAYHYVTHQAYLEPQVCHALTVH